MWLPTATENVDICTYIYMYIYTFDEFHVFGGDGGMEVSAAHTPQSLLERHIAQPFLVQSIDALLIVSLEMSRGGCGLHELNTTGC